MFKIFIHGISREMLTTPIKLSAKILRPIPTRWGALSIVVAQNYLLRYAFRDAANLSHFILLSGHCIPIKAPEYLYASLNEHANFSIFTLLDQRKISPRYNSLLQFMSAGNITHHHQWVILARQHVKLLINSERKYMPMFKHVWAPDETVYLTMLRYYMQINVITHVGIGTTFAQWWDIDYKYKTGGLSRAHPKIYSQISWEELQYLISLPHVYAARKFTRNAQVNLQNGTKINLQSFLQFARILR